VSECVCECFTAIYLCIHAFFPSSCVRSNKPDGYTDSFDVSQRDLLAISGYEPDDHDLQAETRGPSISSLVDIDV
jgi:hypothetical protein